MVRDGGSNIRLGAQLALIPSIHCTIHLLQLVIKDSVFTQPLVKNIIEKCRKVVGYLKHSAAATTKFKSLQEGHEKLTLVQDVSTRWNSSYLMLEKMVYLKRSIQIFLSEADRNLNISATEFQIAENLLIY